MTEISKNYHNTLTPATRGHIIESILFPDNMPSGGTSREELSSRAKSLHFYDNVTLVNTNTVTMGGLSSGTRLKLAATPQYKDGELRLVAGKDQWDSIETYKSRDKSKIEAGLRGDFWYVLDPRTKLPITPGFDRLSHMSEDGMSIWVGETELQITAEPSDDEPDLPSDVPDAALRHYPQFLKSQKIRISRVESDVNPVEADPFGLETAVDKIDLHGQDVFNKAVKQLMEYATHNSETVRQLQNANKAVSLPMIQTNRLSGQLHLTTAEDGANILQFKGHQPQASQDTKTGFYLVQTRDSRVAVLDAYFEQSWTSKDADYTSHIDSAEKYLATYFETIGMLKSSETIEEETLHQIRQKLGRIATWRASRRVKKAIRD